MSQSDDKCFPGPTQAIAEIVSISVEVRLNPDSGIKAAAFADVTLYLSPGGSLTICGCTVLDERGKQPVVLLPSRKGERRYFPVVSYTGNIRRAIDEAVLKAYARVRAEAN
jgi:hypothetical protein